MSVAARAELQFCAVQHNTAQEAGGGLAADGSSVVSAPSSQHQGFPSLLLRSVVQQRGILRGGVARMSVATYSREGILCPHPCSTRVVCMPFRGHAYQPC
jgi:hypothetical protein